MIVSIGFALRVRILPIPVFLSYRVGKKATANEVQPIGWQIGIQPVYVCHANIGDRGYAQVMDVLNQAKASGIRQVALQANLDSMH